MGLNSLYHFLKTESGCFRKRIHRQVRLCGVFSVRRRIRKAAKNSNRAHPITPNLPTRCFAFERPPQGGRCHWHSPSRGLAVSDNGKGLVYQKNCGQCVLGLHRPRLTPAVLEMAYRRRGPREGQPFHSGRGIQRSAKACRKRPETYSIQQNTSRGGDPCGNAAAENFFSGLKFELLRLKQHPTRAAGQNDASAYPGTFHRQII